MVLRDENTDGVSAGEEEGDLLLWILVWSELAAFGALLTGFIVMSFLQKDAFALARENLNPGLAAANTLILVTSGWQAAVAAGRRARPQSARGPLLRAALLGFGFVAIKLFEYSGEAVHAANGSFGSFFELYFLITGFHLLHVLFGAVLLCVVAWRPASANIHMLATLWHVIDLVWLVMFPIVYLV